MKKVMKNLAIVLLGIVVLLALFTGFMAYSSWKLAKNQAEDQAKMVKSDEELLGVRFQVPRDGKDPVDVNLYIPESTDTLPVVFNIHGGAFLAGDADTLDTQSDRISKAWNVIVVNIDYRLMTDEIPIEYGTEEVIDVIRYFKENAEQYHANPEQFCVMGYSAGGYHAAAVLALQAEDENVAAQVLCYPYIGDVVERYNHLSQEQKTTIAPALFVLADNDSFSEESLSYQEVLDQNGISTEIKRYVDSIHGFMEENNPEYETLNIKISKSPEQELMARDAEKLIGNWIQEQFAH